ncbi:MAG: hypothetical protein OdinLCB4_005000 [Candidatus Odinarchaeum yellowstonii]|uniref:Uncharacterized protein n=1 Tax=Odinarchaeota yellowstonii (strain LCB_4) TaxID=1841599 RepID=A0AAF0D1B9_ODILC|nr:MAG: hypothetical protein OdinLCB4_005000 [Candidatus Odinarchaeum yellowstonii]
MNKSALKVFALSMALLLAVGLAAPTLIQARPSQLPDEYEFIGHRFTETYWSTRINWIDVFKEVVAGLQSNLPPELGGNLSGLLRPELNNLEVWTYHAFVNQYNYWMFYSGFEYAQFTNGSLNINGTMPMQTIIQSYRTSTGLEVYSLQTYLLIAVFNDTNSDGVFTNGSDSAYLTVGFSFNLTDFLGEFTNSTLAQQIFNSSMLVTTEPLTQVDNGYTWGMTYKDIKLLIIDPEGGELLGLMTISELGFRYVLAFDQTNGKVTVNTYYTIGEPRLLLTRDGRVYVNDRNAGIYNLTEFITDNNLVLGLVNLQLTSIIDPYHHPVTAVTHNNTEIGNTTEDEDLSDGWYTVYTGEERVFQVDFASKQSYTTIHPNGTNTGDHHLAIARLYNAYLGEGILNAPVYAISAALINLPSVIAVLYMSDNLLAGLRALFGILFPFIPNGETILEEINTHFPLNIEASANYYVIYYPEWNGQRIEHDPVFIAFANLSVLLNPAILVPLVVIGIVAVVVIAMVAIRRRR